METDGGGWTVFQRRKDGSVDFYRGLADYEEGFGDLEHEFWLGLDKIHRLTEAGVQNTLRVEVQDTSSSGYTKYSVFNVGDSSTQYKLTIGGYDSSSTAGNSMGSDPNLNDQKFSTKDRDDGSCAQTYLGAWWYAGSGHSCAMSNLNGVYDQTDKRGITWWSFKDPWYSLTFSEMKVRRNTY